MSLIKEKCLRCGKDSLMTDVDSHEVFCSKCGMVINESVFDSRPERTFTNSSTNKSHTGNKTTLTSHDRGLSTVINSSNKDSSGHILSSSMKSSIKQLRKLDSQSKSKTSKDRNLQYALAELLKMKDKLSLSEAIVEKAAYIYRKALDKKLIRGRSIASVIAASLYAACRESETPRTIKEVATSVGIKRKDLTVSYRVIFRELELKMPVVDSVSCISKIASGADLSEKVKRNAIKILDKAKKENALAGKHPMGVAASALYLASINQGNRTTQKEIADAAGITEVTVRNRCNGLKKALLVKI
ncbi:transcription initiation factor IIB [Nitrosopumilus sp. S4]